MKNHLILSLFAAFCFVAGAVSALLIGSGRDQEPLVPPPPTGPAREAAEEPLPAEPASMPLPGAEAAEGSARLKKEAEELRAKVAELERRLQDADGPGQEDDNSPPAGGGRAAIPGPSPGEPSPAERTS